MKQNCEKLCAALSVTSSANKTTAFRTAAAGWRKWAMVAPMSFWRKSIFLSPQKFTRLSSVRPVPPVNDPSVFYYSISKGTRDFHRNPKSQILITRHNIFIHFFLSQHNIIFIGQILIWVIACLIVYYRLT